MPELPDEMYCSQQIVVNPTFPYLLRQYAKAAIRSQPSDLLRWSTAYFRCLSLNLPPPVKPRLEYPIPKDYDGITPGWLRALLYQFQNSAYVDFKVLWDRWIGACLNHGTLIKILCLGGFTDPHAIPFLQFIGLCLGFICENLTETMIMVCEVLTEEPEGGSAMIKVETFIDIYTFLASLDASHEQTIINHYFTDDLLNLYEKLEKQQEVYKPPTPKTPEKEISIVEEIAEEEEKLSDGPKDAISCPDLLEIEAANAAAALEMQAEEEERGEEETESKSTIISDKERTDIIDKYLSHPEEKTEQVDEKVDVETLSDETLPLMPGEDNFEPDQETVMDEEGQIDDDLKSQTSERFSEHDVQSDDSHAVVDQQEEEEAEEEETPEKKQEEIAGEFGSEHVIALHKIDESICGEDLEEEKTDMFTITTEEGEEEEAGEEEVTKMSASKFEEEEIFIEIIPGIGGFVPIELFNAVIEYMKACAAKQHGMVMPRNIRHYSCPPLEVFD
ncbi:PREDICTED: cyclin-dependent kinase 11A-like [Nicrophorus vespilloides]|uniref:Cyclin-dependent kinase 11A-like n=1 Tax=Nicrophorus vespilloides TaxID=110193 RepID=A0ABM1M3Q0_NICVS|nr:PREDICTED: cyclin-dependent kinase 11A-like [Nicrophorus vespilloides]